MAILLAVTATLAATLTVFGVQLHRMWRTAVKREEFIDSLREKQDEQADQIKKLKREAENLRADLSYQCGRLTQATEERDKAIREGSLAAKAAMGILKGERDRFLESLQSWQFAVKAALLYGARATPELPAIETKAIEAPAVLPSGDFLVEDERLILASDCDDLDVLSLPQLPSREAVS